ncbi:MAG TPA: PRC-barrel domain-containing protein [Longimicrobiales bacterium]|nr:PRC-barrel domain-containing protein [Longimicrobiales bacterium]
MGLRRISTLDAYDFPAYAYDVRGWTVRTQLDDSKVGKVDDIVVAADGSPRYLVVDLGFLKKHVLVPLEYAHADAVEEFVVVERMSAADFESVPSFEDDMDNLTLDYERRLAEAYRVPVVEHRPVYEEDIVDRLVRLDGMDGFRIRGEEDPRGWKVIAGDGRTLGRAVDLVVDRDSMRAAYLIASVDEKGLSLERIGRHVLIPIERVRLTDNKKVLIDGLFARDLQRYPVYGGLPIPTSVIDRIEAFFEGLIGRDAAAADVSARRPYESSPARHPRVFFGTSAPVTDRDEPLVEDSVVYEDDPALEDGIAFEDDGPAVATVDRTDEGVTVQSGDHEIRIRLRGDDIVIERLGAGEPDRQTRVVEAEQREAEPPLA